MQAKGASVKNVEGFSAPKTAENSISKNQFDYLQINSPTDINSYSSVAHELEKYEFAFMRPTKLQTIRQKNRSNFLYQSSIQSGGQDEEVSGKPKVWIHDVTMGDFQL